MNTEKQKPFTEGEFKSLVDKDSQSLESERKCFPRRDKMKTAWEAVAKFWREQAVIFAEQESKWRETVKFCRNTRMLLEIQLQERETNSSLNKGGIIMSNSDWDLVSRMLRARKTYAEILKALKEAHKEE